MRPEVTLVKIQVLYINISTPYYRVVNVWWIESQCISKAAQKDCADVRLCAWNETAKSLVPCAIFFSISIVMRCVILPGFIFLHTPTRWTETAKKECMQNILEYFLYNSQPTAMWTFGKLTCVLFTCHLLLFILSDCCSFVLSPFVKLFLNVYTWFWNCLFCTFNFYNPTVQAFPMMSWRPYCLSLQLCASFMTRNISLYWWFQIIVWVCMCNIF